MDKLTHIQYQLAVKSIKENGIFEGYASVFNVQDYTNDIIVPGAFTEAIEKNNVKLLWQHHTDEPIGVFQTIIEDSYGLYVQGKLLLEVQRATEAYSLLKAGAIEGLSIGFVPKSYEYDEIKKVRYLHEVELWEISLVTFPANPLSQVTSVKNLNEFRCLQEALRRALDIIS